MSNHVIENWRLYVCAKNKTLSVGHCYLEFYNILDAAILSWPFINYYYYFSSAHFCTRGLNTDARVWAFTTFPANFDTPAYLFHAVWVLLHSKCNGINMGSPIWRSFHTHMLYAYYIFIYRNKNNIHYINISII